MFHPDLHHARRLWPHLSDTGGFFAVALERGGTPDPVGAAPPPAAAQPSPGLRAQFDRFRVGDAELAELRFTADDRHFRALAADHAPPPGIALENTGLDIARRRARETKLSTPGAMALAQRASGQVLDLDASEFAAWRARTTLRLPAGRVAACDRGVLLVRHAGLVHGTGFLRLHPDGSGELESQFPKAWMLGDLAMTSDET